MIDLKRFPSIKIVLVAISHLLIVSICQADFEFEWITNETHQGQEKTTPVDPLQINILGKDVEVFDDSSALKLHDIYNVYLDNYSWTNEYSYALLNAFEQIPLPYWDTLDRSMWYIIPIELDNDILIVDNGDDYSVLISLEAFTNANSLLAEIEGVRGKLFSKRLHNAVLRYITEDGNNRQRVNFILQERYDVSLNPPDYSELTKYTTGEFRERFTSFKNEEVLTLITMLEEFPSGMITTPGLKYIIRRLDSTPHPLYPEAPAVAWVTSGYIEFMESAFTGSDVGHLQRLILHEKAHFIWEHLFDEQLKKDWMLLGEWYQRENGEWFTLNETEFVSAYAHGINPNEDMAETISYYIVNPDKLRSVSPKKYDFIQNRVMHGDRYISKIREDLTFRVYNLYPDYVYPGKIIRVKNRVIGGPDEDKKVIVEIELHHESDLDLSSGGYIRIFSPSGTNKYIENYLWPVDPNQEGGNWDDSISQSHVLRTVINVSKHLPNGYWQPRAIQVWDSNGTARFTSDKKFGWKMYIENPLEDIKPPEYIPNSVKLTSNEVQSEEGDYILVTASFLAPDDTGIDWFRVGMNDQNSETYGRIADGGLRYRDGSYDKGTGLAKISLTFPHYMPSGLYQINYINLSDLGYNSVDVYFTGNKKDEKPVSIYIDTKTPDTEPPQLDVNRIKVVATPTNPDNPNGETFVDITFYVRDNISGYDIGAVNIRDPLGAIHHRWHYPHDNKGMYVSYETGKYRKYVKKILLPVGSHPGIWGITNIYVADKAGNKKDYDFTEIVRFEVDENAPAAPTITRNALLPNFPNPFNPETWIPYQLATESKVNIAIYSADGKIVRNLDLGYQPAGIYQDRQKAAHWDGRNNMGERVASGIYFYTLETREFSDTRKMMILK